MKFKIISDGTNTGTHLINVETGERVQQISKISWEIDAEQPITKTIIELINIPVEIITKAEVNLSEFVAPDYKAINTKSFEKEIKIITKPNDGTNNDIKVFDNETNKQIGAISKIKWTACPHKRKAKVEKIKFDKEDW